MAPPPRLLEKAALRPPAGHAAIRAASATRLDSQPCRRESAPSRAPTLELAPSSAGRGRGSSGGGPAPLPRLRSAPSPFRGAAPGGGAWVSVSCKRRGDREIEEFPGTAPGVLRFARRAAGGVQCRGPVTLWKFQRELGENRPRKSPTLMHLPPARSRLVFLRKGTWG